MYSYDKGVFISGSLSKYENSAWGIPLVTDYMFYMMASQADHVLLLVCS